MDRIFDTDWPVILGPGSAYDRLQRDPSVSPDPHIANASLIYDDYARDYLAATLREYSDIAQRHCLPYLFSTVTWRANAERIAASPFADMPVNRDCAEFAIGICEAYGADRSPIVVSGCLGPRGDAYKPAEAPGRDEARRFHGPQIEELADTRLDCISAKTLPAFDEALGMAEELAETGKPYILSFVVLPSGTLLDGTPFGEAIAQIDDTVSRPPDHYMVNCVHARNYASAMTAVSINHPEAARRVVGLEANTSAKTPEELDGLEAVETETPELFGAQVWGLNAATGARYLGGCCGSGTEHIEALARAATGDLVRA